MEKGDMKKALDMFQEAAFKYPGEAAYWATLAIVYYYNNEYSDSFENIIKATSLNTLKPEIWYNLGVLYEKCKQPDEAIIAYQKVQDLCPGEQGSIMRINAIHSRDYAQQQNNLNLEMKQPQFQLPNSLTILKKYKQQNRRDDGNGHPGEGDRVLPPGGDSQNQNGDDGD